MSGTSVEQEMPLDAIDIETEILLNEAARIGLKTSAVELSTGHAKFMFGHIETDSRRLAVRDHTIYELSPIYSSHIGHPLNGAYAETTLSRSATRAALEMAQIPALAGRAFCTPALGKIFAYAQNLETPLLVAPDNRELRSAWLCSDTTDSFQNVVGMLTSICDTLTIESMPKGQTFRFFFVAQEVVGVSKVSHSHFPLTNGLPKLVSENVLLSDNTIPHPSYFEEAARILSAFPTLQYGTIDMLLQTPDMPANLSNFNVSSVEPKLDFSKSCWAADGQNINLAVSVVQMLASLPLTPALDPIFTKLDQGVERYDLDIDKLVPAARELGMHPQMVNAKSAHGARRTLQIEIASTPVQFRNGAIRIVNENGSTSHINGDATKVSVNKQATKEVLGSVGVSFPEGRQFSASQLSEALKYAEELGYPICVKPLSGSKGQLVSTELTNSTEVAKAFRQVATKYENVVVERNVDGEVLRVFYLAPDMCTAQYQARSYVVGDGKSNITSLIEQRNANRDASQRKPAIVNRSMVTDLAHRDVDLSDCIVEGKKLVFGATSHLSTGIRITLADDLHPSYLENALKAFQAIDGYEIGAMDMIVKNPKQLATKQNHWVLEINSSVNVSGFRPATGTADINGCKTVLRHLERVLKARKTAVPKVQTVTDDNHTENISRALEHMERAAPNEVATIQGKQLEALLQHAWQHTHFYRRRLNCLFFNDKFIPDAWAAVPLLTRQEAQEHRLSRRAFELKDGNRTFGSRTSGSSGSPLDIRWNRVATVSTRAAAERMYRWHNLDLEAPLAEIKSFGGAGYEFPGGRGKPGWSLSAPNAIRYRLSVSTPVEEQLAWLALVKAPYLTTYPTMVRELALEALRCKSPLRFDAILSVGEVLTPEIRQLCAEAFGAKVIDSYGCQEMGKLAIQCDQSEHYHICLSNVLLEVLDENGQHVAPGESGRVVVTSLFNYATPFIRYDIGDYARLGAAPCQCGRSLPVITSIEGRRRNMVTLPNGEKQWLSGTILAELASMVNAQQSRIIQRTTHHFELRFVTDHKAHDIDRDILSNRAKELIHPDITLEPVQVKVLERSSGGKYEDVVGLEQMSV